MKAIIVAVLVAIAISSVLVTSQLDNSVTLGAVYILAIWGMYRFVCFCDGHKDFRFSVAHPEAETHPSEV